MTAYRRRVEGDTDELATTIGLYVLGETSLGRAAERLEITRWEPLDILEELGFQPRLGTHPWPGWKPREMRRSTSNERVACPLRSPHHDRLQRRPDASNPDAAS